MSAAAAPAAPRADGLAARRFAVGVIEDVVRRRLPLDDQLEKLSADPAYAALPPSDRGLVRAIATGAVRRLGTIRKALAERLPKGLPPRAGRLEFVLIAAAAQIVELGTAAHAAVDTGVTLAREDAHARHFADLANAVLRRIAAERDAIAAASDLLGVDTPPWLAARWSAAWGSETAALIAAAHRHEPAIDITVKADPEAWADRLGAEVLPTGSLRLSARTAVRQLPGFAEGAWWVQDAAAAVPARLLGDVAGRRVLDLCAAPGGKTAQLAAAGAHVTALDRSEQRMRRLRENMERLGLAVETVVADALSYDAPPFDDVLLDAPCSATGTIRRHPDVAWSRTLEDLHKLVALQSRLLDRAAALVAPGGRLVYATCSLEREEGEAQIAAFLKRSPGWRVEPVDAAELGGLAEWVGEGGGFRSLPCHLPHAVDRMAGADGFFAARLVRAGG
ncbi:MAG: RsmB/NOP family class I SAM-dependent RNA methyltransferase [Beijerinckiaceae bacterium]